MTFIDSNGLKWHHWSPQISHRASTRIMTPEANGMNTNKLANTMQMLKIIFKLSLIPWSFKNSLLKSNGINSIFSQNPLQSRIAQQVAKTNHHVTKKCIQLPSSRRALFIETPYRISSARCWRRDCDCPIVDLLKKKKKQKHCTDAPK